MIECVGSCACVWSVHLHLCQTIVQFVNDLYTCLSACTGDQAYIRLDQNNIAQVLTNIQKNTDNMYTEMTTMEDRCVYGVCKRVLLNACVSAHVCVYVCV